MALRDKQWRPVSIHNVVLAWLRAELSKGIAKRFSASPDWQVINALVRRADLSKPEDNRRRLRLLYAYRDMFVGEIPPDTQWYEVSYLSDDDLDEVHVVNFRDWTHSTHNNEVRKAAAIRRIKLEEPIAKWESPILWGHDENGPFTIFEGNNRLTAYAGSTQSGLNMPVFVGLSSLPCAWHIFDEGCGWLLYDRWRSTQQPQ